MSPHLRLILARLVSQSMGLPMADAEPLSLLLTGGPPRTVVRRLHRLAAENQHRRPDVALAACRLALLATPTTRTEDRT